MTKLKHSTHSVALNVPYDTAFTFLSDWRNQPRWAVNFVKGIRQEGRQILMTTPIGEVPIDWRANRDLGTIDLVFPESNTMPTRLTPLGDGSLVYTFTFTMPSDAPDEAFRQGQRGMDDELQRLKRILEE